MIPALGGSGSFPPCPIHFSLNRSSRWWTGKPRVQSLRSKIIAGGRAAAIRRATCLSFVPKTTVSLSPETTLATSSMRAPGSQAGECYAALWARITKNTDWSTGPLACPFARSLAPLTRSLASDCSLRLRPPLRSLVCSLTLELVEQ